MDKKYHKIETEEHQFKQSDDISVRLLILRSKNYYRYLCEKWLIILAISIIGGVFGLGFSILKKHVYLAKSTFVLEDNSSVGGSLSQYSGLASMVGVDLGAGGNGIFQGDNIIELYKSRLMLKKTLLTEANFGTHKQLLIERYITINKMRESWKDKPALRQLNFNRDNEPLTRVQDSVLTAVINDINVHYLNVFKADKKSSIFSVEVKAKDELFAQVLNNQIVQNVNDFYVQTKTKKALFDLKILMYQSDSIRNALNSNITGVAIAYDVNPNPNAARQLLRVPSQKRQIDVEANKAILTELIKNVELSKMSLLKETPLIQIIDQPVLPLEVIKYGKVKSTLIGMVLAGFLTISILLLTKIFKNIIA